MSIYNGFVNHEQETRYYELVKYLVLALEKRLVKFYKGEQVNEVKFIKLINKIRYKITKMEMRKYAEPKFGESIQQLLKSVDMPFKSQFSDYNLRHSKLDRQSSNCSNISLDFSLAHQVQLPRQKFKLTIPELQADSGDRRKRYKSLQKMKNESILEVTQYENERKFSSKLNQFKNVQLRMRPPKIEPFIENMRRESNDVISSGRKMMVMKELDSFIGQRRKKVKKNVRTVPIPFKY